MKRVKVYKKMQGKNRILGLEFFDFLILILLYLVVFLASKNLFLNLGIVLAGYLALRFYKKGKAPHWTGSLIRFLMTRRRYPETRELEEEIFDE
ncbi:MAG: hypothetical protein COV74_01285 [Candidatus Omnitrophica bacterium CG11_big_fil_rev_8_21_14_0_20_45_26]|uniref:Type IV conjugative transfer system protein TraL n=1 Tax=Candidatus Abzuiibacterium crystallinum TaxID=1974748 RepID=A0A2H0LRW6_9BACT|nr:MAG: hypothetical protein COV74_01285 [Candidatus Omnitrophica bacterium CG11_big_fil_rev_8_21_14_0_20_45_26]PIW64803.1 MAG: hypothetical protein COW12_04695 [Candidatus Omnitrophica bacterium CG12_big_fil_rev_8_21_14_0_65_45_16]